MLDLSKPVQTREGKPVRILCTDANYPLPIIGLVDNDVLRWTSSGYCFITEDGRVWPLDLVNAPIKHTKWLNIYVGGVYGTYDTRDRADAYAEAGRIACIEITYEEGQGL